MKDIHICVRYHLKVPIGKRADADRALAVFEQACPVTQTLKGCVTIKHNSEIEEYSQ